MDPDHFNPSYSYPPLPLMRNESVVEEGPDQSTLTARYTEECLRFIRENRDGPFFLYLAHMYVHLPLYPPAEFVQRAQNGPYGAEVECIDWSVGAILSTLREEGIDKDTLVVFTSDNGSNTLHGASNSPLSGRKGQTWEGGIRVPCLMWWPGRISADGVSREVSTAMDFLPTFAALAGADVPGDRIIDGHDIRPILFGEPGAKSAYEAFYYYRFNSLEAVRSGRWKLRLYDDKLYDLDADVGERINLFESNPEAVGRLRDLAVRAREDLGDVRSGLSGRNCRPVGLVQNPTLVNPRRHADPVVRAAYD